jgi:RimJ/RimL family protein N-acetyltransferase
MWSVQTIETARLYLRMLTMDDLDALCPIFSDPAVVKYVGDGKPISREKTQTALESILRHWQRHGFGRWAFVHKDEGRLIGFGGLRLLIDTPEVVYHLAKSHWGMGLATESAHASLRYGFEELRFEKIVAVAKPQNHASVRVMQKVGMKFETFTRYYEMDVTQYSLSREEYSPSSAPYRLRND